MAQASQEISLVQYTDVMMKQNVLNTQTALKYEVMQSVANKAFHFSIDSQPRISTFIEVNDIAQSVKTEIQNELLAIVSPREIQINTTEE